MAHMIENGQIAWKGSTPWHGLGVKVDESATGIQMLESAGLNWRVQRRSLAMRGSDGLGLVADPLKEYKAIVRSDNDTVFAIPTARYQVVQNEEIVDLFKEYCEAGHAHMDVVGALKGGAVIWALARLNGATKAELKGGDKMEGYVLFATSHDGTLQTMGMATSVRVVCNNTLQAAIAAKGGLKGVEFKMKHSAKWTPERATEAKSKLGIAIEKIQATHELAASFSNVTIDHQGRVEFISRLMDGKCLLDQVAENTATIEQVAAGMSDSALLDSIINLDPQANLATANPEDRLNRVGKAILDAIVDSPGSDMESANGTLWGAINGVSYYTDHLAARNQDNRLSSAWFGQNALLKRSAVQVAADMAGISIPSL